MPRSSFTLDALSGATPGLSRLAQQLAGGDPAYQGAYDTELTNRSKLAHTMAATAAAQAQADQNNAETRTFQSRPDVIDEGVALQTGTSLPLVRAVQQFARTGVRPMRDLQGPADESGVGPGQAPIVDDATQSRIAQALARSLPMRTNLKDTSYKDYAEGNAINQGQDLFARAANGEIPLSQYAGLQYAQKGNAPYHFDSSGLVGNNLTGTLDESGGRAQAVTGKEKALAAQAQAGAVENYAQAAHANAQATMTRQQIEQGVRSGQLQVITDGNGNITILDKASGVARPALGPDGKPMQGKGSAAKLTEDQGKATGWLIQAENAFANMNAAMAGGSGAESPGFGDAVGSIPMMSGIGNAMTGAKRQQFNQATSSLSEALLRAATGAGVNRDEAIQKIRELTPVFGDSAATRQQKLAAIPLYIESLKVRAGPGAAPAAEVVNNFGARPAAPFQRTPGGAPRTPAAPAAAPAGGGFVYLGKEG